MTRAIFAGLSLLTLAIDIVVRLSLASRGFEPPWPPYAMSAVFAILAVAYQ
jgi:hypothetical protein